MERRGSGERKDWVFGVGSPHGDDQIGWRVVDRLTEEGLANCVPLAEMSRLLAWLPHCRRVVLVDGCVSGAAAGAVHRFTWPDPRLLEEVRWSSHGLGLGETLALAETLGQLPPTVVIFGVEAENHEPGGDLSPPVLESLPRLCERIHAELRAPFVPALFPHPGICSP